MKKIRNIIKITKYLAHMYDLHMCECTERLLRGLHCQIPLVLYIFSFCSPLYQ